MDPREYLIFFLTKFPVEWRQNPAWGPILARVMTNFVKHVFLLQRSERSGKEIPLVAIPLEAIPLVAIILVAILLVAILLVAIPLVAILLVAILLVAILLVAILKQSFSGLVQNCTKTVHKHKSFTKAIQKQYKNHTQTIH